MQRIFEILVSKGVIMLFKDPVSLSHDISKLNFTNTEICCFNTGKSDCTLAEVPSIL